MGKKLRKSARSKAIVVLSAPLQTTNSSVETYRKGQKKKKS